MEITEWMKMTHEQRINEAGNQPPCPFCKTPRVLRSDYIRCNPCGVNWLDGEDVMKDPRIDRYNKMLADMRATVRSKPEKGAGVQPAPSLSDFSVPRLA